MRALDWSAERDPTNDKELLYYETMETSFKQICVRFGSPGILTSDFAPETKH